MSNLDLRPLSVGEILDRTFTLYRGHFVLFLGISAIPHTLLLILNLAQVFVRSPSHSITSPPTIIPSFSGTAIVTAVIVFIVVFIVWVAVYLFSQGATVIAVSELYLGRTITISEAFRRMRGHALNLLGVVILTFLANMAGFLLLVIPGIYLVCRLVVSVPAALIEDLGPATSMERSFDLTRDNAGRAFLILLLYFALAFAASALFAVPFEVMMVITMAKNNPETLRTWTALTQIGSTIANVLVTPVITIASAILYYDLRVRKEAFDLQMMMNPLGGVSSSPSTLPTMLS